MTDFYEIDFLDVETKKSGDAITLRYSIAGATYIHVVDGGYLENGRMVIDRINKNYNHPRRIDHVVSTHPDHDHTGGLRKVLEEMEIGTLWMNRPWLYADDIIHRFSRFTNPENLRRALKKAYPNTAALENIAIARNIPIQEAFQGARIGAFTVMAPRKSRYLDKIVDSEKTGQVAKTLDEAAASAERFSQIIADFAAKAIGYVRTSWGVEYFPNTVTSTENEMSIVQYANICGRRILLTADTGLEGLQEVLDYAPVIGLSLPGIDNFQVPHHGSRRNVSTKILDDLLGLRSPYPSNEKFLAVVSSAKADEKHPRNAVIKAMHHRGARILTTENGDICVGLNAPERFGWISAQSVPYPSDQEE